MPGRAHLSRSPAPHRLPAAASVALLLLLSGCGDGTVAVDSYGVPVATRAPCTQLLDALPARVAGESQRQVQGSRYAAAWGQDPLVLRCGVGEPEGFDRFSPCQRANGIDWFVPRRAIEDQNVDVVMTTIGRDPAVEVVVPAQHRPPVEAMVDLTPVLKRHTRKVGGCR